MKLIDLAHGSILFVLLGIQQALAFTQTSCSSQNTGLDFAAVTAQFMTASRCKTTCNAEYAFAVVQFTNCWCSNYAPANTIAVGSCNQACAGYGYEQCGNQKAGLFGYIALDRSPSGTIGAAAAASSSSSTSTYSVPAPVAISTVHQVSVQTAPQSPVTVEQTVTAFPSVVVSVVSLTPSAKVSAAPIPSPAVETSSTTSTETSTTSDTVLVPVRTFPSQSASQSSASQSSASQSFASESTTSQSSASSWSPTPVVSVMTVTGQVKTLTITPTSPPAAGTAVAQVSKKSGFFSDPGKVAGVFTVVGLAVLALAGLLIWFLLRRRRHADAIAVASVAGGDTPQRRPSRLSQMGLLGGSTRKKPENTLPGIQTSGWGPGNNVEKSPTDSAPMDVRSSYPRIVDQRLDPVALWNPLHDNGSHVSIRSLQDNQDYSRRMLRVANPDH